MIDKLKKIKIKFINFKEKRKNEKINTQKLKEIGLLVTAAVLIGIGYTNFSTNTNNPKEFISNTLATSATNNIGDVQLVSSSATIVENNKKKNNSDALEDKNASSLVDNVSDNTKEDEIAETMTVSGTEKNNSNYFEDLKMNRDDMYSKSIETYQKIIDNESVSSEQKSIAIQEIDNINNLRNSINIAEELIKLKDFEDVVIFSSNNKISVIVRIAALSENQVAQIQNIVSKELGVEIDDITISNK